MNLYETLTEQAELAKLMQDAQSMPAGGFEILQALNKGEPHPFQRYMLHRWRIMQDYGCNPTDKQKAILDENHRFILTKIGRQCGKTEADVSWVIWTALLRAPALILVLFPTKNLAEEFVNERVRAKYQLLGEPSEMLRPFSRRSIRFANGSRILALASKDASIRMFSSVALLIIDEAARVPDALFDAVYPMIARSRGRIIASSTAFYRQGWFFRGWEYGGSDWARHEASAYDCPWHSRADLERARRQMPLRVFEQEYMGVFHDSEDSVFRQQDIEAMFRNGSGSALF